MLKHVRNSNQTVYLNKCLQNCYPTALLFLVHAHERHIYLSTRHLCFSKIYSEMSFLRQLAFLNLEENLTGKSYCCTSFLLGRYIEA